MPYFIDVGARRVRRHYCEEQELLDIANKIRAAGSAEALEAFFPSEQGQAHACLIANALNFGCKVGGYPSVWDEKEQRYTATPKNEDGSDMWTMEVPTAALAKRLATELGWEVVNLPGYRNHIVLPERVGNTAHAFDEGKGWTRKYVKKMVY